MYQKVFRDMKVIYKSGKGKNFVLFPMDLMATVNMLVDDCRRARRCCKVLQISVSLRDLLCMWPVNRKCLAAKLQTPDR